MSNCKLKRDPCIGDRNNPICQKCTCNTSNPNFDYSIVSPQANLERQIRYILEG